MDVNLQDPNRGRLPASNPTPGAKRNRLGVFNLNDPRWGRDDKEAPSDDKAPHAENEDPPRQPPRQPRPQSNSNQGPPDLDELWRDFNRKLGGLLGGKGGNNGGRGGSDNGGGFNPTPKSTGIGMGLIAGVAAVIWLGTGFFIVQEGQQSVITQFGKYYNTVGAGFNWRLPYPIQRNETVSVTQIRSVDVGRDNIVAATGLRESAMLTADQNIVEIKFAVQYRLNDARAFLFESRDPDASVVKVAETALREVIGKMKMDAALAEERDQIAPRVRVLMQSMLDLYKVGIEVVGINLQQDGVRPPEQVQAAFDDVLKAGQERERAKNEAQAYANDVVPRARGAASRLTAEAEGYRARIVAQAEGDANRFSSVLTEYQKAPQVTRDRMYVDSMQQIYSNVTKVLVDSKSGSNLLYLPLDKIMQMSGQPATTGTGTSSIPLAPSATQPRTTIDDPARSRQRESR
jgi:membrane protease subunit HflK